MTHVIIHAGYHKTGTTSFQDYFHNNRVLLKPYLAFYGKNDFQDAGAMARIYGQRPFPWRLRKFRLALRGFLRLLADDKVIVLSRETFSGAMPGHRRASGAMITSYRHVADRLARVLIAEIRRRFGRAVRITFFYTTRANDAWLRSVHGHLLRSIRLREDFDRFRGRFSPDACPVAHAQKMARILAPIPVVTAALEQHGARREGPAAALLDLLEIPADLRQEMAPATRENTGQSAGLRADFLRLNQLNLGNAALRATKQQLVHAADDTAADTKNGKRRK